MSEAFEPNLTRAAAPAVDQARADEVTGRGNRDHPEHLLADAENIGRTYGEGARRVIALDHATCQIAPGDRIAIIGPSGSGKSTLLQLLAGLDTPSSGVLRWPALGPQTGLRPAQIAVIFQQHSLLEPLSVVENVALPLLLYGVAPSLARVRALAALERLDLAALCDRLPDELSGGQAQRVTVARALAGSPRLILADEPTGQLDHATAERVITLLLQVLSGTDTALVVSTHDPAVAVHMPRRWQIHDGILEAGN